MERATAVAKEHYKSLLTGLQAVCQIRWKVQQIVFVGETCGSIDVESFRVHGKGREHACVKKEHAERADRG